MDFPLHGLHLRTNAESSDGRCCAKPDVVVAVGRRVVVAPRRAKVVRVVVPVPTADDTVGISFAEPEPHISSGCESVSYPRNWQKNTGLPMNLSMLYYRKPVAQVYG